MRTCRVVYGGRVEDRPAIADGPVELVRGRALLGPTRFPVQPLRPELYQGERVVRRTGAGKRNWIVAFDPPPTSSR